MDPKPFYKSKLFWLGALQIFVGAAALVGPFLEAAVFTPAGFVALASGVVTIVLRFLTDQPIAVSV